VTLSELRVELLSIRAEWERLGRENRADRVERESRSCTWSIRGLDVAKASAIAERAGAALLETARQVPSLGIPAHASPVSRWCEFVAQTAGPPEMLPTAYAVNRDGTDGEAIRLSTLGNIGQRSGVAIDRVLARMTAEESAKAAPASAARAETTTPPKARKATVNARMVDTVMRQPESRGWTAQQWAAHLGCGKTAVLKAKTWQSLKVVKAGEQQEEIEHRKR
jgi:hypothetical protein